MANIKTSVDELIDLLNDIKKINDAMQAKAVHLSNQWNQHESIDDKLHEALSLLGE